jgi:hypothetical protein
MRPSLPNLLLCAAAGFFAALAAIAPAPTAAAFPKPSVYPVAWQLKFDHPMPKRIVVKGADNVPVAYWYLTFTVVNNSDQEQRFLPVFEMLTDDGTVIRSDKDVPAAVFDAIKAREKKRSLQRIEQVTGRILIGEDQARDGVAIWKEPSPRMGTFHIFVSGLSGEVAYMKDGEEVDQRKLEWFKISDEERKKYKVLRKTLDLTYQIPGDEIRPEEDPILLKSEQWVMR